MQLVEIPDGLILKRGTTEVMVTGANAADAIRLVLAAVGRHGASRSEIIRRLKRSPSVPVDLIIDNLTRRRFLTPQNGHADPMNREETSLDIFFWQFGGKRTGVAEQMNKVRLTIIGVNQISRHLTTSLMICDHNHFKVLDHPQHRNLRMFDKTGKLKQGAWPNSSPKPQPWQDASSHELGDCLIATSDFGGKEALRKWNKLCLDKKVHFMPVVLRNMIGYVGPIVVPEETACYECLLARQQSHNEVAKDETCIDKQAFQAQSIVAFHPCMATILGELAAFELLRFYGNILPDRKATHLLEIDLLGGSMARRTVLKVPRCSVCSPLRERSLTNLNKAPLSQWMQEWVKVQ